MSVVIFMKEGLGMKRVVVLASVAMLSMFGMVTAEFAVAADAPSVAGPTDNIVGGKPMKGEVTKTLKGRVWSQWADNPDGELSPHRLLKPPASGNEGYARAPHPWFRAPPRCRSWPDRAATIHH